VHQRVFPRFLELSKRDLCAHDKLGRLAIPALGDPFKEGKRLAVVDVLDSVYDLDIAVGLLLVGQQALVRSRRRATEDEAELDELGRPVRDDLLAQEPAPVDLVWRREDTDQEERRARMVTLRAADRVRLGRRQERKVRLLKRAGDVGRWSLFDVILVERRQVDREDRKGEEDANDRREEAEGQEHRPCLGPRDEERVPRPASWRRVRGRRRGRRARQRMRRLRAAARRPIAGEEAERRARVKRGRHRRRCRRRGVHVTIQGRRGGTTGGQTAAALELRGQAARATSWRRAP
jgi:hypothetical protein